MLAYFINTFLLVWDTKIKLSTVHKLGELKIEKMCLSQVGSATFPTTYFQIFDHTAHVFITFNYFAVIFLAICSQNSYCSWFQFLYLVWFSCSVLLNCFVTFLETSSGLILIRFKDFREKFEDWHIDKRRIYSHRSLTSSSDWWIIGTPTIIIPTRHVISQRVNAVQLLSSMHHGCYQLNRIILLRNIW